MYHIGHRDADTVASGALNDQPGQVSLSCTLVLQDVPRRRDSTTAYRGRNIA